MNFGILRPLQLGLLALVVLVVPLRAESTELPQLSMQVNDFAAVLKASYSADLNRRLTRFDYKTGYAIYIVFMAGDPNQSLVGVAGKVFELNQLERRGYAGTVLVLIAPKNGQVAIATSRNLRERFSGSQVEAYIRGMLEYRVTQSGNMEYLVENALHDVLAQIDPWFYRLDPPSVGFFLSRPPTAEMILFALAPFLGVMTGIALMAFTPVGRLTGVGRFFLSGLIGCLIVGATVFLIRQPGGISPGMFYYGVGMGFVVTGAVGVLRPFWFNDQFEGRKPGDTTGPLYFRWG